MDTLTYDGTFTGWLCAVFDVYAYKLRDATIRAASARSVPAPTRVIHTDEQKATRVWKGLVGRTSTHAARRLYTAFLSGEKGMEDQLLGYIRYVFSQPRSVENDYNHPSVRYIVDTDKKVYREKHRIEALVRFQHTKHDLYYVLVSPDFDVLPLIKSHFEERYSNQRWIIYDTSRNYGLFYDLHSTSVVEIDFDGASAADVITGNNLDARMRHSPKGYWRFLAEKGGGWL
jgi:probable DNA metabolism protein